VLITLQVAIGAATPPFGCNLFTAIAVFRPPFVDVVRGVPPISPILLLVAVLLVAFPWTALGLRCLAFRWSPLVPRRVVPVSDVTPVANGYEKGRLNLPLVGLSTLGKRPHLEDWSRIDAS